MNHFLKSENSREEIRGIPSNRYKLYIPLSQRYFKGLGAGRTLSLTLDPNIPLTPFKGGILRGKNEFRGGSRGIYIPLSHCYVKKSETNLFNRKRVANFYAGSNYSRVHATTLVFKEPKIFGGIKLGLAFLVAMLLLVGCQNQPKVIAPVNGDANASGAKSTGIFADDGASASAASSNATSNANTASMGQDMHTVVVEEVLPTSKYVYMHVKEGEEKFWVATQKQDVKVGETYFYRGGLLKTNFESKEYNRIFDKVYLVSKIVPANHGGGQGTIETHSSDETLPSENPNTEKAATKANRNITKEGSIKIADIVADPDKYNGQSVQVSGECVKVNPNIMGRNWIHLKDGSKDDYDFVVTSILQVQEGQIVTMKGTVMVDKDFGAGYRYDLIVEEGVIVAGD